MNRTHCISFIFLFICLYAGATEYHVSPAGSDAAVGDKISRGGMAKGLFQSPERITRHPGDFSSAAAQWDFENLNCHNYYIGHH